MNPTKDAHRLILRGMAAVGLFSLLGKVAGAAKEMAVAWRYGVSAEVDAYLFVFNLVSWPVAIWFSVLAVVLIPMEARMRQQAPGALPRFRAELLGLTLIVGLVLAAAAHLGLPALMASRWLGLPARTAALAVEMVPVLAWVTPPALLVALYSTWMMSAGRHLNTLLEGVPALGIFGAVLVTGGIEPLVWGTLAGTLVQLAFVAAPVGVRAVRDVPAFTLTSPHWVPFWQGFGVMMLGQAVMSMTSLIDQFFAAHLGEGAISSLGYAGRMLALVLGIVATAVTRATLPVFSAARAGGEADTRKLALRWAAMVALVGVLAAVVGSLLAPWAVRLLYQRGTFTAADTATVVQLLRYGLVQLPFYFASLVLVSLHSSLGRYHILLASGALGLTVKVIASYVLLARFSIGGLMLAHAAVYAVNTLLLARTLPR